MLPNSRVRGLRTRPDWGPCYPCLHPSARGWPRRTGRDAVHRRANSFREMGKDMDRLVRGIRCNPRLIQWLSRPAGTRLGAGRTITDCCSVAGRAKLPGCSKRPQLAVFSPMTTRRTLCIFGTGFVVPQVQLIEACSGAEAIDQARGTRQFTRREVWDRHRLVAVMPPSSRAADRRTDLCSRGAHRRFEGREESKFVEQAEASDLVLHRIFQLGEAQLDASIIQALIQVRNRVRGCYVHAGDWRSRDDNATGVGDELTSRRGPAR